MFFVHSAKYVLQRISVHSVRNPGRYLATLRQSSGGFMFIPQHSGKDFCCYIRKGFTFILMKLGSIHVNSANIRGKIYIYSATIQESFLFIPQEYRRDPTLLPQKIY
jgi:hypothetical protein